VAAAEESAAGEPAAGEAIAMTTETDLLIIGGGPAGLATAIRARLAGLTARVLERRRPPLDKACGEGLMPDAVMRLGELGIELDAAECRRFRGIRYLDGEVVAEGVFPHAGGLGVRRLHLHRALAERAAELGVELCWGVAVTGLAPLGGPGGASGGGPGGASDGRSAGVSGGSSVRGAGGWRVRGAVVGDAGGEVIASRWVVGADGLHSRVRSWAGLAGRPARLRRFGVRRHFACRPWTDLVEVYWGPGCEAYVTPVGAEEVGVALLWNDPGAAAAGRAGFDRLLAHFPALAARLAGARAVSRDRGAGPLLQRVGAVCRGNVALVGDASGYVDALTGEGLAVALHQAAALVEALRPADAGGELSRYAAAHRRIGRLPGNMTALMLAIERRSWLRRRVIRALAAEPALFSRLLGIHARALPPARLGIDGALRLAYRLVRV
jgi:menaquinone-9 beta-reductase